MGLNYQSAVTITAEYVGQKAVDQARNDLRSLTGSIDGMRGGISSAIGAFKGLAAAFAVKEVVSYVKGIIDTADSLNDLATSTGLTVEVLDSLKGAAEDNGVSFEGLQAGLKKFTVNMALQSKELASIGVTSKDASTALLQLADRFAALPGPQERAALATKVFGRGQTDLVRVLGEGSAALQDFGSGFTGEFARRADTFNDTLGAIKRNINAVSVVAISQMFPSLQAISEGFKELTRSGPDTNSFFQEFGTALKYLAVGGVAAVEALIEGFDVLYTTLKVIGEYVGKWASQVVDEVSTMGAQIKAVLSGNFAEFAKLGREFDQRRLEANQEIESKTDKLIDDLANRTKARIETMKAFGKKVFEEKPDAPAKNKNFGTADLGNYAEQAKKAADAINNLKDQQRELNETNALERNRLNISDASYQKKLLAIKEEYEVAKATKDMTPSQAAAYADVSDQILKMKQEMIDFKDQQKESFGTGAKEAIREYIEAARDTAAQTKSLFGTAFKGIEDSIVNFVKTGKLSFADLADSIVESLVRIGIQRAIAFGLSGLGLGGFSASANGNVIGSGGPLPLSRFANGGVVNSPHVALFGEGSTPEAFVPLPDGRSIPVSMRGGGGGGVGSVSIVVNIDKSGGEETASRSDDSRAREMGGAIREAVVQEIIKQKRPGGILS